MQQAYTSFVKQTAFDYPINTILTINMNFNEKLICTPAGHHTVRATHKRELSRSLVILLPDAELVQLLFIFLFIFRDPSPTVYREQISS